MPPTFASKDAALKHALQTMQELQAAGFDVELVVEEPEPGPQPLSAQVASAVAAGEPTASSALKVIAALEEVQGSASPQTPAEEWKSAAKTVTEYLQTLPPHELKKAAVAKGYPFASLAGVTDGGKCGSLVFLLNPIYSSPGAKLKKAKILHAFKAYFDDLHPSEKKAVLQQEQVWSQELNGEGQPGVQVVAPSEVAPAEMAAKMQVVYDHAKALQSEGVRLSIPELTSHMAALGEAVRAILSYRVKAAGETQKWHAEAEQVGLSTLLHQAPTEKLQRTLWWWSASLVAAQRLGVPHRGTIFLPRADVVSIILGLDNDDAYKSMAESNAEKVETLIGIVAAMDKLSGDGTLGFEDLKHHVANIETASKLWETLMQQDDKFPSYNTLLSVAPGAGDVLPKLHEHPKFEAFHLHAVAEKNFAAMSAPKLRAEAMKAGLSAEQVQCATLPQLRAVLLGLLLGGHLPTAHINGKKALEKIQAKVNAKKEAALAKAEGSEPAPSAQVIELPELKPASYAPPPAPRVISSSKDLGKAFGERMRAAAGILLQRRMATKMQGQWRGAKAIQSMKLEYEGAANHLGGVHQKEFFKDETGQRWLFKPDKYKGAVAAAEEAAAEIVRRVGLPTVEVRRVTLKGRVGSVQPMIAGASPLPSSPTTWTPEQRQGVMMHHVVDWLLGDHDGNHTNFIVVGGVPMRIDRGQAFKFIGQDRLDLNYEPNRHHGAPPHAALLLYREAAKGTVHVDPHTLLPLVKAIEAIPDEECREMLRPVAEAGAKTGSVGWYRAMAQRAAEKKGGPPSESDVAEAFLDELVERKRRLRADLEAFLGKVFGKPFRFVENPAAVAS